MIEHADDGAESDWVMTIQLDRDCTATHAYRMNGDPFDPSGGWEAIPLPEPAQLKAGVRHETGVDRDGRPYVRPAPPEEE